MIEPDSLGDVVISIFSSAPIFSEDRPVVDLQAIIQTHLWDLSSQMQFLQLQVNLAKFQIARMERHKFPANTAEMIFSPQSTLFYWHHYNKISNFHSVFSFSTLFLISLCFKSRRRSCPKGLQTFYSSLESLNL